MILLIMHKLMMTMHEVDISCLWSTRDIAKSLATAWSATVSMTSRAIASMWMASLGTVDPEVQTDNEADGGYFEKQHITKLTWFAYSLLVLRTHVFVLQKVSSICCHNL